MTFFFFLFLSPCPCFILFIRVLIDSIRIHILYQNYRFMIIITHMHCTIAFQNQNHISIHHNFWISYTHTTFKLWWTQLYRLFFQTFSFFSALNAIHLNFLRFLTVIISQYAFVCTFACLIVEHHYWISDCFTGTNFATADKLFLSRKIKQKNISQLL
jgi:hypothetical protein